VLTNEVWPKRKTTATETVLIHAYIKLYVSYRYWMWLNHCLYSSSGRSCYSSWLVHWNDVCHQLPVARALPRLLSKTKSWTAIPGWAAIDELHCHHKHRLHLISGMHFSSWSHCSIIWQFPITIQNSPFQYLFWCPSITQLTFVNSVRYRKLKIDWDWLRLIDWLRTHV